LHKSDTHVPHDWDPDDWGEDAHKEKRSADERDELTVVHYSPPPEAHKLDATHVIFSRLHNIAFSPRVAASSIAGGTHRRLANPTLN
jgi:hypothetical protein